KISDEHPSRKVDEGMSGMKHQSVHELFSAQAAQHGRETAIDRVVRRATYAELESRSNQVGNRLLASGIVKGSLVAIVAEDPIEVVTAILGVLKAGGVFVPLDPSFPEKRLEVMISQVQPQWYVLESKFQSKLDQVRNGVIGYDRHLDGE